MKLETALEIQPLVGGVYVAARWDNPWGGNEQYDHTEDLIGPFLDSASAEQWIRGRADDPGSHEYRVYGAEDVCSPEDWDTEG